MELLEKMIAGVDDTELIVHITTPICRAHIECNTMDLSIKHETLCINPEDFEMEIDLNKCKIEEGLLEDMPTIELSRGDTVLNIDFIR